jgi:hypothetical protein
MRVTNRERKMSSARTSLGLLIEFLNFDFTETATQVGATDDLYTPEQIRQRRLAGLSGRNDAPICLFLNRYGLTGPSAKDKAVGIQRELIELLTPIAKPYVLKEKPGDVPARADLEKLLTKIYSFDPRQRPFVEPSKVFNEKNGRLTHGANPALAHFQRQYAVTVQGVKFWWGEELNESHSAEAYLYDLVRRLLVDEQLSQLFICPQCSVFAMKTQPQQRFCGSGCRTAFHNRARLESGFFPKYRKSRRKADIAKARRLAEQGRSLKFIKEHTCLPQRVIRQLIL